MGVPETHQPWDLQDELHRGGRHDSAALRQALKDVPTRRNRSPVLDLVPVSVSLSESVSDKPEQHQRQQAAATISVTAPPHRVVAMKPGSAPNPRGFDATRGLQPQLVRAKARATAIRPTNCPYFRSVAEMYPSRSRKSSTSRTASSGVAFDVSIRTSASSGTS